jgi:hypothetical protein
VLEENEEFLWNMVGKLEEKTLLGRPIIIMDLQEIVRNCVGCI